MNRFTINPEHWDDFENLFKQRAGLVDGEPGFIRNAVLRPQENTSDQHIVMTLWESHQAFEDWTHSESFRKAHAKACPSPTNHVTEPLHMGQTKARCADNGCSIGKRRNAGMAHVQGFPSGESPGGYLRRCAFLQWNNHCFKSAPCI